MYPSREQDRARLEQELRTNEYQELLGDLHRRNPFLRQFATWTDVIAFMRDPRKDEVLRPIFTAHSLDQDPRWRTILLVIFWPGLESIYWKKRLWDRDPDDLWQNIVWTFLKIICRIDLNHRPNRLFQKVLNDTVHHLHDEYRCLWDISNGEFSVEMDVLEVLAGGAEWNPTAAIELREEKEIAIRRLRGHVEASRITEADYLLLVGTRVYGKPVVDYARENGLAYQAVKKRRQRIEAAIREFEEKNPEI